MEKQRFRKRFLWPVLLVLFIMAPSWLIYNLAWRIGGGALHQVLAAVFGTLLFLSVTFGVLVIYPMAFFRGAPLGERVVASLVVPFLWATKECARLFISYTFLECVYYYFNPLNVWLLCGVVVQMGLAEMFCRRRLKKTGETVRVLHRGALAAIGIGLFLVISMFAWGQGENVYVIYLEGFRKFFGPGAGV